MLTQILAEEYRPVVAEVNQRLLRKTKLEVLNFTPKDGEEPTIGVPGIVLLFVARKGSSILKLVRNAGTEAGAKKLTDAIRKQPITVGQTIEENISAMVNEDVFAEFRYGGETFVETIYVPKGMDFIFMRFPFSGGPLAKEGFVLAERVKAGSKAGLEAVVIRIDPPLSAAERTALKLVPPDQRWHLLGDEGCGDTYTAMTVAFMAVAATVAVACVKPLPDIKPLTGVETRKLGPVGTARRLLELRREAISRKKS